MRQRGLTLLELVIVVGILAALAAAAVAVTDQVDAQGRFDVTRAREQQLRDAIVGPVGFVNGSPVVQGFVADMGRLPATLAELVAQGSFPAFNTNVATPYNTTALPVTDGAGTAIAGWSANFGAGWRGPYVIPDQEAARAVFRDGWGNVDGAVADDFGWQLTLPGYLASGLPPFTTESLVVTSLGSDGKADAAPTTWDAADTALTIAPADYLVNVSGLAVTVTFSGTRPASSELRLYYPATGRDGTLTARYVVSTATASAGTAIVYSSFVDPQNPTGAPPLVPLGVRSLAVMNGTGGSAVPFGAYSARQPVPITLLPRATVSSLAIDWTGP